MMRGSRSCRQEVACPHFQRTAELTTKALGIEIGGHWKEEDRCGQTGQFVLSNCAHFFTLVAWRPDGCHIIAIFKAEYALSVG